MTEKERVLLAGCLNGDKAAWDVFVLQYSNLVYHTIKKTFTVHHAEPRDEVVEDLYQELFVALLKDERKKLRQFRGDHGCSLASWLRVVVARLTIDFLRKQPQPPGEMSDRLARDDPEPGERLANDEKERLLNQLIQSLPPRDRILVELLYLRALSPEEIAAILNTSVNAVYTQKSRVLAKLRETLRNN